MLVYYINLALILVLAYPLCIYKPAPWKKLVYLSIEFLYLWFLATFRSGIGFDFQSYINIFADVKAAANPLDLMSAGLEPGFLLLNKLMSFFVSSSTVMYGIYAFLTLAPIFWFLYKYCRDAWFSAWLYATLTFFYTTMNFIRQGLACSVVVLSYKFLKEKKPIPYIIIILLAASFHKTALIMIPLYFFVHYKLTWKRGAIYAGLTLAAYLTSAFIVDIVTDYIFTGYKGSIWLTEGFPLHFIFIPAAVFGTCLALKWAWEKRDPDATMLLNLMMFTAIVWVFITRHFILERFSMYMYIFVLVAIPSALESLKAGQPVLDKHRQLSEDIKNKKTKASKEQLAELAALAQNIKDHKKYYWCAVAGVLIVTFIYHDYGGNVNGFHGVFPYQSVFPWL